MKHKDHRAICEAILGKSFPAVDRWMDAPAYRYGPGHRRFRHDARAVVLMALREGDAKAGAAALIHEACDFAPNEILKLLKRKHLG